MPEYSIEFYANIIIEANSKEEAINQAYHYTLDQCDNAEIDNIEEIKR